jgi:hypothetical protein
VRNVNARAESSRIVWPGQFRLALALAFGLMTRPAEAQALPSLPVVSRGACPFECCRLGNWTARESLPVYQEERKSRRPIAVVTAGQSFTADSADLYTLDWGIIIVHRPMRVIDVLGPEPENDSVLSDPRATAVLGRQLAPGDTIYHIGHVPETGELVWLDGVSALADGFWVDREEDLKELDLPAVLARPMRREWWVRIRRPAGRSGWIQAWNKQIEGTDACG